KAIQTEVPTVRYAVPYLRSTSQVLSEEQNWTTQVGGTDPDYFEIRSWPMTYGTRFTDSDVDAGTKVVILGATVAEKLFGPNSNPVGLVVRIRNIPFQVIAVASRKGQNPNGQDYDDAVFIPRTTFIAKIQGGLGTFINGAIFISATNATTAEKQVTELLRDRHRIGGPADDDFSVRNLAEVASAQEESSRTVTLFLAIVAAVSLLVGGIGIMNIMLVSVTERTREIGTRIAVGARARDILRQFLGEAVVLAVTGGLLRLAAGGLTPRGAPSALPWPGADPVGGLGLAVAFRGAVGGVLGLFPGGEGPQARPLPPAPVGVRPGLPPGAAWVTGRARRGSSSRRPGAGVGTLDMLVSVAWRPGPPPPVAANETFELAPWNTAARLEVQCVAAVPASSERRTV